MSEERPSGYPASSWGERVTGPGKVCKGAFYCNFNDLSPYWLAPSVEQFSVMPLY